jgi:hypothetical protein
MSKTWQCRMTGQDDANEWHNVEAMTYNEAAEKYAEQCDANSGGELYGEDDDRQIVEVRLIGDETIRKREVRVAFEKNFYSTAMQEGKSQ